MNEFALSYAKQVHQFFELYYANWLPENPIQLGDIGVLTSGILFERKSSIQSNHFNLSFSARPATITLPARGNQANHYIFKTGQNVSVNHLAKGDFGLVNGGIEVKLGGENSFFFNLAGAIVQEIDDQLTLSRQVVELYRQKLWQKEWCIVTSILHSSSTTILGSRKGNQSVLLEAKTEAPQVNLYDAQLTLGTNGISNLDYQMISGKNAIPLFKISKLKIQLFGGSHLALTEDEIDIDEIRERVAHTDRDLNDYLILAPLEAE